MQVIHGVWEQKEENFIYQWEKLALMAYNQFIKTQRQKQMRSQIDRKCPPTQSEYYLTIHQRPILLQCQTHISTAPTTDIEIQEEPYIENFYCYTINNELYKVTKIRIGDELVTMIDRMSFDPPIPKENLKKDDKGGSSLQEVSVMTSETSSRRTKFSVVAQSVLRLLQQWVKQHEPELLSVFLEIKERSLNEKELKQNLSLNPEIRQSFIKFKDYLNSHRTKKTLRRTVDSWGKVIIPVHDQYLMNEQFLNSVLDVSQSGK